MTYDERIERVEAEIEALRDPLRSQYDNWLRAVAAWAAVFWEKKAREVVTRHAATAKQMSKDEMGLLKGRVNSLVANAQDEAERHLGDGGSLAWIWPHLQADMTQIIEEPGLSGSFHSSMFRQFGDEKFGPTQLTEPVAQFAGLVGGILREHGFEPNHYRDRGAVTFRAEWSEAMIKELAAYAELDSSLIEKQEELKRLNRAREEAEAGARWDSA